MKCLRGSWVISTRVSLGSTVIPCSSSSGTSIRYFYTKNAAKSSAAVFSSLSAS